MKNKISVVIICKNEERIIRSCLDSVTWADEIVIVDSGSTDKTIEIVSEYTDKIFVNSDWKGFGFQKKLAVSKASNDWVLSLDSDEVVSDELRDALMDQLDSLNDQTVYRINRLTHFCGKFIYHSGWYPSRIVRLFNKKKYDFNDKLVHETVSCKAAEKIDMKGNLYHYTFDSLEEYIDKRNRYAKAWAKGKFEQGKKVNGLSIITHSLFAFIRHYIIQLGFLDGYHGYLIATIQMQYTFNKYNFLKYKNLPDKPL